MLFLTLPTRGDHPEVLERVVAESMLPRDRIVIVRTDASAEVPLGTVVVDDFGEVNIQRWWNLGIEEACQRGASVVAVVNDDIVVSADGLATLEAELHRHKATIATPGRRLKLHRNRIPLQPVLVGSLWLLDVSHGLRPDEAYRWWFGDDDLDIRARSRFAGIITVPLSFLHLHAGGSTEGSAKLQALVGLDQQHFKMSHPIGYYSRMLHRRFDNSWPGRRIRALTERISGPKQPLWGTDPESWS